jgi:hypothetical protein
MPQIRTTRNQITLPKVPDFIQFEGRYLSVSSYTPEELKKIGKRWTDELVRKAKEQKFVNP